MEKPYLLELSAIGAPDIGYITTAGSSALPFEIKRVYWTYATPDSVTRGNHAHYELEQVIVAVKGTIKITLENTAGEKLAFLLHDPRTGLFIPKMYWRTINFSPDGILLCLASTEYNEADYLYDFDYFKSLFK